VATAILFRAVDSAEGMDKFLILNRAKLQADNRFVREADRIVKSKQGDNK